MTEDLFGPEEGSGHRSDVLVRHAYEGVLDRAARLISFGSSKSIASNTEIGDRQERQAVDDVLLFAIYARRLIDLAKAKSLARNVSVGLWHFGGTQTDMKFALNSKTISMWGLLGVIVHHKFVEVVRYQLQVKALVGAATEVLLGDILDGPEKYQFQPKVFVQSDKSDLLTDKSDLLIVDILDMTGLYLERLVHPIVSVCERRGLYLEDDYLG